MNKIFQERIDKLSSQFVTLQNCKSIKRDNLSSVPNRGIYLFIVKGIPIYVGRTNRMRARLLEHSRPSSKHNAASFAFKLAKEQANKMCIDTKLKRSALVKDKKFNKLFSKSKQQVAAMDIKYIEINNPIEQYLFELYVSEMLKTPYNDFENH
ncbi:MAG: hypothetical protein COA31_005470 [Flavobacteriales bacterium]|nr:hypothetical protein [Flavobacteriales bacterium]